MATHAREKEKDRAQYAGLHAMNYVQFPQQFAASTADIVALTAMESMITSMDSVNAILEAMLRGQAITGIASSTGTSAPPMVTYVSVTAPGDDYFKPEAAREILRMANAGLDEDAPEDADKFMDWLNNG